MHSAQKATLLRDLHHGPEILVLPNAWDCASARIFEQAGFPAFATTSAGIAFASGYPDGQHISLGEMLASVRRIAHCVRVPVTADLEAGYGDVPATAEGLIESGAVGLNLEDRDDNGSRELLEVSRQTERIRSVRRAADQARVPVVINARTDYYLGQIGEPRGRFQAACDRLKRYIDAGADCVFVPGIDDPDLIRRFVDALRFPLNVLVGPNTPPIPRLRELGVARVTLGGGIMRAGMGLTKRIAEELKGAGTYQSLRESAADFGYAEANSLFEKSEPRSAG